MGHVESMDAASDRLAALPPLSLAQYPTPVEEMARLRAALGGGPRLLVKRDDALSFAFGGNKVRKLELVAARAVAEGADTLVTVGGVQSNHARVTAAAAAKLGMRCVLIVNGEPPARPAANALLDRMLGAEIIYIPSRAERAGTMREVVGRLTSEGRRPFAVPLGASTGLGALGYRRAVDELLRQTEAPDVVVHATSSGGTQAGLVAGFALRGAPTRVVGISADDPADELTTRIREIIGELAAEAGVGSAIWDAPIRIEVDDSFVGGGYGVPTEASREAQALAARTEALFVDHTYTAKALAATLAIVRAGAYGPDRTILFWHTGGQVGLFA